MSPRPHAPCRRAADRVWYVPRGLMVRLPRARGNAKLPCEVELLELPAGSERGERAAHTRAVEPAVPVARGVAARPDRGRAPRYPRPRPLGARAQRAVRGQPHDRSPRPRDAHARGLSLPASQARHVRGGAAPALQRRQLHAQHDRGRPRAGHGGPLRGDRGPRRRHRRPSRRAGRRPRARAAASEHGAGGAGRHREHPALGGEVPGPARTRPRRLARGRSCARTTTCIPRARTRASWQ